MRSVEAQPPSTSSGPALLVNLNKQARLGLSDSFRESMASSSSDEDVVDIVGLTGDLDEDTGLPCGKCTVEYSDGSSFDGDMQNGERHGKGAIVQDFVVCWPVLPVVRAQHVSVLSRQIHLCGRHLRCGHIQP